MFVYKINCPQINFPNLNTEEGSTFLTNKKIYIYIYLKISNLIQL